VCNELGREAREAAERKLQTVREGWDKRKQLIEQGRKLKDENAVT
jgi:hypothetical protein